MKAERWRRLDELFVTAARMQPQEQEAFLDREVGGDSALRAELASLLAADEEAGEFLEGAVEREVRAFVDDRESSRVGQQIGAYRVIRLIGRGGMSDVYLAARADREYQQRVAIKVIKRGMDSDEVQRRFQRERQILASLSHPNIARLLDGGTTEDGLPFFVLEYIEGLPIDRYCASHRASVPRRLRLFRTVCAAVQEAHRNLVVHRDLKPSNIFVTGEGEPKLLDFGIAKLLRPEQFPQTIVSTSAATRVMTPGYASPEQVRGEAITTASDVYSLGVLLYELLTGQRPYRLEGLPPAEVERVICESEPLAPSQARGLAAEASLGLPKRRLRGDLDRIVLKALRKEPMRRYVSVEQMSEDIRRNLEGLPVLARGNTLGYRARKFVGRHWVGVLASSLIALAVLAGAVTTAWQARAARLAQRQAEIERDSAEEIATFLEELFSGADPDEVGERDVTARELLDRGAGRIRRELAEQPELQARLMQRIGSIYRKLGYHEEAEPLLRDALARRQTAGAGDQELAETLNGLAMVLHEQGDEGAAEPLYRRALALYPRAEPSTDQARCLASLAELLHTRGDLAEAEPLLRRAVEIQKREPESPDTAKMVHNLASLLTTKGDLAAAEELHRETLALRRHLFGERHRGVAETLNNLARVLFLRGDLGAAEKLYRDALDIRREIFGESDPSVARTLNNLAKVLYVQGKHQEAEPLYRRVLALKRELPETGPESLARSLDGHARVLHALGDFAAAGAAYDEAVEMMRAHLPADHGLLADAQLGLGELWLDRGEPRAAEPPLREALRVRRLKLGEESWKTAAAACALGVALADQGRGDVALPLLEGGLGPLESKLGTDNASVRRARRWLAALRPETAS